MAGQGSQVGVDDVGDEDEVAGLLAIAADLGCLAGEQPLAGHRDDAGLACAVLERTVHVRVAQRQGGQMKGPAEQPEVAFARQLGRAIRRKRPGRGPLRRRQVGSPAIDGTA